METTGSFPQVFSVQRSGSRIGGRLGYSVNSYATSGLISTDTVVSVDPFMFFCHIAIPLHG